jgi:transposase
MMFGPSGSLSIYLCTRSTDMRKSIDGLCGEANNFIGKTPTDGSLFVFLNARRDKVKLLWWDKDGYWLFYKRLEAGTFQMPQFCPGSTSVAMQRDMLTCLLSGIDLGSVKKRKRFSLKSEQFT